MELIRMQNLVENGVELAGWGSDIELSNKETDDGEPIVADREIGKNDVEKIADYLTFLEWQFKMEDDPS